MIFIFALLGAALVWLLLNEERPPPAVRWGLIAFCAAAMLWTGYLTHRMLSFSRDAVHLARQGQRAHQQLKEDVVRKHKQDQRVGY